MIAMRLQVSLILTHYFIQADINSNYLLTSVFSALIRVQNIFPLKIVISTTRPLIKPSNM
jgi:hypothetical protein